MRQREFFIDNLLVRIQFIIVTIKWTGLATWDFEFPFQQIRASEPRRGVLHVLRPRPHRKDPPGTQNGPSRVIPASFLEPICGPVSPKTDRIFENRLLVEVKSPGGVCYMFSARVLTGQTHKVPSSLPFALPVSLSVLLTECLSLSHFRHSGHVSVSFALALAPCLSLSLHLSLPLSVSLSRSLSLKIIIYESLSDSYIHRKPKTQAPHPKL